MTNRSLQEILEQKFPLPKGFVEWARRKGIAERIITGEKDIAEALEEYQREKEVLAMNEFSQEERQVVDSELTWLAEILQKKFGRTVKQVRRLIRERAEN